MELKPKRRQFSKQVIKSAVADVESGISRVEVCKKYGMSYHSLSNWIQGYASKAFLNSSRAKIASGQKRLVIQKIQDGELSIAEASLSYGVKRVTLQNWIRVSNKERNVDLTLNESTMPVLKEPVSQNLQRALHNANLKVLALETMIDVAEEQLKISIRKKSGAKQ